jgi:hypothetical protein
LATTDVMLASTVQFSRYGRSRPRGILRRCRDRSWPRGPCGRSLRTQQRARPANPLATGVPSRHERLRTHRGCTNPSRAGTRTE